MEKEITVTIKAPIDCTEEQFEEWVRFCLHDTGSMSMDNPLHEYDIETSNLSIR